MQRQSGVRVGEVERFGSVDFDEEDEDAKDAKDAEVYSVQVKSQEPVFVAPSAVKRTLSSACLRLCVFGKWKT